MATFVRLLLLFFLVLRPQHYQLSVSLIFSATAMLEQITSFSLLVHQSESKFICCPLSLNPGSVIALLVYSQSSQFSTRLSIWHHPYLSQRSDHLTDVFAFCSVASL